MKKIVFVLFMFFSIAFAEQKIIIKVDGMTCPMCIGNVKKALSTVSGVKKSDVYLKDGRAEVVCEDNVKGEALVEAIKKAKYGASLLK